MCVYTGCFVGCSLGHELSLKSSSINVFVFFRLVFISLCLVFCVLSLFCPKCWQVK